MVVLLFAARQTRAVLRFHRTAGVRYAASTTPAAARPAAAAAAPPPPPREQQQQQQQEQTWWQRMRSRTTWADLADTLLFCGQILCVWHVVNTYVVDVTICIGPSMLPTIHEAGDVVVVERATPRFRALQLGDVVVAKSPRDPTQFVCKRVLGLPGDRIFIDPSLMQATTVVPAGHVWLQGDNYNNSTDSRNYGPVPIGAVKGRVVLRIWPLRYITRFGNNITRLERIVD